MRTVVTLNSVIQTARLTAAPQPVSTVTCFKKIGGNSYTIGLSNKTSLRTIFISIAQIRALQRYDTIAVRLNTMLLLNMIAC